MIVARTRAGLQDARARLPDPVGVVPTMGALHDGHRALLRTARRREHSMLATLFVNRTQFNEPGDYAAYPRDESADLAAFEACGVDLVFAPSVEEMYPEGFGTRIDPGPIGADLEGARRPGHFAGVATVVAKISNLTKPARAYFGQKDWQQTRVDRPHGEGPESAGRAGDRAHGPGRRRPGAQQPQRPAYTRPTAGRHGALARSEFGS